MILRALGLVVLLGVSGASGATLMNILGNPVRVYVETHKQIQQSYRAVGGELPHVAGWALYNGTAPNIWGCQVHVPPLTQNTLWLWEHEFKHCKEGTWHDPSG